MKPMTWAVALAAVVLCLPGVALAQKPVGSPANVVPQVALCVGDVGEPCIPLTAADFVGGDASEATLSEIVAEMQGLRSDLATPADSLPPQPPVASSDTTLTQLYQSITASGSE